MQKERLKSNKLELRNHLSASLFQGLKPNFQSYLKIFKVAASKFTLKHPLTPMVSKTALPFWKSPSNRCICSKDWWELWIVGIDRKKTKRPQQWGVNKAMEIPLKWSFLLETHRGSFLAVVRLLHHWQTTKYLHKYLWSKKEITVQNSYKITVIFFFFSMWVECGSTKSYVKISAVWWKWQRRH